LNIVDRAYSLKGAIENAGVENAGVALWNANPIQMAVVQHGVNRVFLLMLLLL